MSAWSRLGSRPRGYFARLKFSLLCCRDIPITSVRDVIGWWESRRISFNLIVGSAGILTCVVIAIVGLGAEILFDSELGLPDPPIFGLIWIVAYGVIANICFTAGWMSELLVRKLWPRESDRFASNTLATGLVFSVLLTLAPAVVIGAAGAFGLLRHFLAHKP